MKAVEQKMSAVTYSSYGKKMGFRPLAGKETEFEELSERLFSIKARIRRLVFYDPHGILENARDELDKITERMKAISR